ncbi:hypothetical protein D3C72_175800 [compost metagenome]
MGLTIWSIGHSNHQLETFIALLAGQAIEMVIDVRSRPVSRWNPQFNKATLAVALQAKEIGYQHAPELGGLHEGAGHGEHFETGLDWLEQYAGGKRIVVLCSEGDPRSCHREAMIGVAWRRRGHSIIHILPGGELVTNLTPDPLQQ